MASLEGSSAAPALSNPPCALRPVVEAFGFARASVDMPLIAGRAERHSGEAHLRRIVAGFSRLLPYVHTTARGKTLPTKTQGATPGFSPR